MISANVVFIVIIIVVIMIPAALMQSFALFTGSWVYNETCGNIDLFNQKNETGCYDSSKFWLISYLSLYWKFILIYQMKFMVLLIYYMLFTVYLLIVECHFRFVGAVYTMKNIFQLFRKYFIRAHFRFRISIILRFIEKRNKNLAIKVIFIL